MHVVAIIAAAGRGHRLGAEVPKQFLTLGARTLLQRSLDAFDASDRINEIVVVVPAEFLEAARASVGTTRTPLSIVEGGPTRQESVARGYEAVKGRTDLAVVHDAARPFVSVTLIGRTIDAAIEAGAAVAAVAARDTVKQASAAPGPLRVQATLPRASIYLAQTPQAFRRDVLEEAIALGRAGVEVTDEAALAEQAGHTVRLVEGEPGNIKITTGHDLEMARARVCRDQSPSDFRTGLGYDLHRLVAGRPLVLGGVTLPFDRGLVGHSDADAVCHAVTDAILGAAVAGDIGQHFPDHDPRWKDASSLDLLKQATRVVRTAGFRVRHVDVVVIAERPKIQPYVRQMRERLAEALDVDTSRISVKGKTNEGVGEIGRGEAIAVHAVATLRQVETSDQ